MCDNESMTRISVSCGPSPQPMLVADVRPGDEWTTDKDTTVIDDVTAFDLGDGVPRVRITGRIVRGWGKSQKPRTWTFVPDQQLEIVRR